ncbi:SDH family Clp fold serine proteinase [Marinobacter sp. JSM 1782161]|uniref:SDH family Clp fold serine proteinase n=1 Tax=Marinobacter sp. JSM 1782161 TaxID=2685906 RepID=UPI001403BA75|nr:hypothetical protein [Marinobacter sp. JSM 1782161]
MSTEESEKQVELGVTDYIVYAGEISRNGYDQICDVHNGELPETGNQKAVLILSTLGGDPDAAFRICRSLHHHYPDGITVFIPGLCKSAGTLIAIGASQVWMCDRGELGPLDVQLAKPDELFGRSSGLDLPQAIENLQTQAIRTFRESLLDIRMGGKLSTSMAAKISTELTTGLFQPIFGQIDPTKVGETQRAMLIGYDYGERLNNKFKNLKGGALQKLTTGYPSHSFVIDRKEARELFQKVNRPPAWLQNAVDRAAKAIENATLSMDNPLVVKLPASEIEPSEEDGKDEEAQQGVDNGKPSGSSGDKESRSSSKRSSSGRKTGARTTKSDEKPD